MKDINDNSHENNSYQRPHCSHQCGRAKMWRKPCWQGPQQDGNCGGTSECTPYRKGDRYECRRPKHAGGPCVQGPLPDGQCANTHMACLPRPRLRQRRKQLSLVAAALVLASIAALMTYSENGKLSPLSMDAGPLSNVHSGFTREEGCGSCHTAHDKDALSWLTAAITPHDQTEGCLNCHQFGGPNTAAHNAEFPARTDLASPTCNTCHTEHKGDTVSLVQVTDEMCSNCHESGTTSFLTNHKAFATNFPSAEPNTIYFNHDKHISEYFSEDKWLDKRDRAFGERARDACVTCHQVETASREVKPRPYQEVCANCHSDQIREREFVLLTSDYLTPLSSLLLGLDEEEADDDEIGGVKRKELIANMAESGFDAIGALLEEQGKSDFTTRLFNGMNSESIKNAATFWAVGDYYEPEGSTEIKLRGWKVGENSSGDQAITYLISGHEDPVIHDWVDYMVDTVKTTEDEKLRDSASRALAHLLDREEGAGACGKCHQSGVIASAMGEGAQQVQWGYLGQARRPYTRYSHAPHINLLGSSAGCKTCHKINATADYTVYFEEQPPQAEKFVSSFSAISKDTCTECHRNKIARFDCQLCHTYHYEPGFNVDFQEKRKRSHE